MARRPPVAATAHDGELLDEIEAAMAPPRSHARFPLFDSLRGLAAISILVIHAAIFTDALGDTWDGRLLSHLDIGVPFFFLLSAFLLYRPFVAARVRSADRPAFSGYARRRFLRIAPAYWAALTIAAIVPGMAGAFSGNWWVYYGLLQNYPVYTPSGTCASVFGQFRCGIPTAWSLSIEVFFYALLPFFVLLMAWIGGRRRAWILPEVLVLVALSAASFAIQSHVPQTDFERFLFFSPIGRGWWFALGLGLAAFSVWAGSRPEKRRLVAVLEDHPWLPLIGAAALYLVMSWMVLPPGTDLAFPIGDMNRYLLQYFVFGVIALLVVLPATFGGDGPGHYRRFLRHPIPTWLGVISYGIFLWQFPALIFLLDAGLDDWWPSLSFPVVALATFALTIVCATVSYYGLERPLMRWGKRRFESTAPEPAVTEVSP
ncbi:MAG: acyltransferase [Solirubrobacterales bacterium]